MPDRSFRVSDSPDVARRIVSRMTVDDGSGGMLPPGVSARKTGPGSFSADGPFGTHVQADLFVRGDGRGGSIVTERFGASSFLPGAGFMADLIHGVATSPSDAYERVKRRGG